jgi:hypothetical protein
MNTKIILGLLMLGTLLSTVGFAVMLVRMTVTVERKAWEERRIEAGAAARMEAAEPEPAPPPKRGGFFLNLAAKVKRGEPFLKGDNQKQD